MNPLPALIREYDRRRAMARDNIRQRLWSRAKAAELLAPWAAMLVEFGGTPAGLEDDLIEEVAAWQAFDRTLPGDRAVTIARAALALRLASIADRATAIARARDAALERDSADGDHTRTLMRLADHYHAPAFTPKAGAQTEERIAA